MNSIYTKRWKLFLIINISCCCLYSLVLGADKTRFNDNWRFHLGDLPNAYEKGYDDHQWRNLDLPHDYSIELGFDTTYTSGWRGGYTTGGIGWYRKSFHLPLHKKDQKTFILFDGVYMNSEVWINGHYLGKRPYGYISFYYDLTPYLTEGDNVIAVKVNNKDLPSGRWYTGSGIYRNVWLITSSNIYIPIWGTYFRSNSINDDMADCVYQVALINDRNKSANVSVQTKVLDRSGKVVYTITSLKKLASFANESISQLIRLSKPALWSPESPNTYTLETNIYHKNVLLDKFHSTVGIRNVQVDPDKGFILNGNPLKIKGVCNHHDGGPVGSAVPEDLLYSRLKMLKEMGCNAIRTSHNPAAPEFYHMCDTMGIMVMDEAFDGWHEPKAEHDYGNYFDKWWQTDLKEFLIRDRNHPSVVMWSIGNEVPDFTPTQQKLMVDFLHTFDSTRPVTQARGYKGSYLDVAGFNGHGEEPGFLEKFRKDNPGYPMVGTEMTHSLQTRGVYQSKTKYRKRDFRAPWEEEGSWEDYEHRVHLTEDLTEVEVFDSVSPFYQSSFDNAYVRMNVRQCERMVREHDYLMGTFRWTGFDYLGEALRQPARTSNFGIIDLAGFPKDHYFLYQSLWSDKPMVHLLPHWTHLGKEDISIPVVVYTNAESAELFVNGRSLGSKRMNEDYQLVWKVPYEPGKLEVVAKTGGTIVARKYYITAKEPSALNLEPDKYIITNNSRDIVMIKVNIIDELGTLVPEGDELIKFSIQGPGKIIGVENGDIKDFSPVKGSERRAFKGQCLLIIQSTSLVGDIAVEASSEGLKSSIISIKVVRKDDGI